MNSAITAIVVDDEYHCIENLVHYINELCPRIKIVGTGSDVAAFEALVVAQNPDLAFLDIHLFGQNIFDVLPAKGSSVVPVFVTAYADHALSAFKANALDYLLKPLEAQEISRCYEKICQYFGIGREEAQNSDSKKIKLKDGDEIYLITLSDIILLRAKGFYTEVFFNYRQGSRQLLLSKPLSLVCEEWSDEDLMRVHRSYAVNLRKIERVIRANSGISVQIAGHTIPISKPNFEAFRNRYCD